jgi:integrase
MPVYQDEQTKTWYVKCYYTDYTGTKRQRKKRGFKRQKDAKEWERNFLETQQADVTMTFENFIKLYNEDMKHRLREHTYTQKQYIIEKKLLPFFGKLPISQITPVLVRKWQNELTSYRSNQGKPYSETYLRTINNQLAAVMNYAVRYYGLRENPCRKAGTIGKNHAEEMQVWTSEEFKCFLEKVSDKPSSRVGFLTLYYTGIRIGELLALERADIDFENCKITINKSYQRLKDRDVITPPKTPRSIRTISIPIFLRDELKDYTDKLYGLHKHDRIFPYTKYFFEHEIKRGVKASGVKSIRIHDLRHSHASLLIELGLSPVAVADRLGHEKVETTLNTYSHLFPHKRDEVAEKLQNCF